MTKYKQVRILVHESKHGQVLWMADTRPQVNAAMRQLFDMLDADGCYIDDEGLEAARAGEHMAIYRILKARQDCEYESWRVVYATDPTEKLAGRTQ